MHRKRLTDGGSGEPGRPETAPERHSAFGPALPALGSVSTMRRPIGRASRGDAYMAGAAVVRPSGADPRPDGVLAFADSLLRPTGAAGGDTLPIATFGHSAYWQMNTNQLFSGNDEKLLDART
jgi:hypothetical protein